MRRSMMPLVAAALLATMVVARAAAPVTPALRPPPYGNPDAKHTFVVFGSFTCPFTAQLMLILTQIVRDSHGTVKIEWRNYPAHPADPTLHVVALAKPDHFWTFMFGVMSVAYPHPMMQVKFPMKDVLEIAKKSGLTAADVHRAYKNPANWELVKQDYLAAKLLGIKRTPGLFYSGYFLTPNGMPHNLKAFDASLRRMVGVPPHAPATAKAHAAKKH